MRKNSGFVALFLFIFLVSFGLSNNIFNFSSDTETLLAGLGRISEHPKNVEKFLQNYPFPLLSPPVTIAEGFESYDGVLQDRPGALHWAIDYVQKFRGKFRPFLVFSSHEGEVIQSYEKTFGKYVVIRKRSGLLGDYNTLYAHLDNIPDSIPFMKNNNKDIGIRINETPGIFLPANTYIGEAGVTGNTKGIPQLHFELHLVNTSTNMSYRVDPYGIYKKASSGQYPKPGNSLKGRLHYWTSDLPTFAGQE